jgi:hypothetical protein
MNFNPDMVQIPPGRHGVTPAARGIASAIPAASEAGRCCPAVHAVTATSGSARMGVTSPAHHFREYAKEEHLGIDSIFDKSIERDFVQNIASEGRFLISPHDEGWHYEVRHPGISTDP